MGLSFGHLLIVGILVVLLFGRGRISDLMGDVAKGIKAFRKGMQDDELAKPNDVIDVKPTTKDSDPKDV